MAEAMTLTPEMIAEPMEAVIISRPWKGKIVALNGGLAEMPSPQEAELFHTALDELAAALEDYVQATRRTGEELHRVAAKVAEMSAAIKE